MQIAALCHCLKDRLPTDLPVLQRGATLPETATGVRYAGAIAEEIRPHDGTIQLPPVANWYRLLVSNAWQADQILEELQGVRVTVGASLRARH